MSPAGVTQMEAAAQVPNVRLGDMPPMHSELLLPLLPNAPTAPQHQHSYGVHQQLQMPPGDVQYTMMFPAGAHDRVRRKGRARSTSAILLQWEKGTRPATKSFQWTRRQRRPMSATEIHVFGCVIHNLTERSAGVSNMEAPYTKG